MQSITHCPACQTQFVVTEEQLNQHDGTVRCGHCLHVFNAAEQLVKTEESNTKELNTKVLATNVAEIEVQADQYDYLAVQATPVLSTKKSPVLLWILLAVMFLTAIAQSVYFLRHQIAMYYPNIKPHLVRVCEKIGCSIDLPKKIALILIDDSDIQEDAEHSGVMRLSTTLINQAGFYQAYPNLELTLTDVEDKPKLRRIFKPIEYLPAKTDIALGLAAGAVVKVKLAMTSQGIAVAGYRVFVSY
jgi:predicted Zn finger-like uncharacterized protein